jgi:hypothetical protein
MGENIRKKKHEMQIERWREKSKANERTRRRLELIVQIED